jgi:hypothetical protein
MPLIEAVGRRRDIELGDLKAEDPAEIGQWLAIGEHSLNGYERNKLYENLGNDPASGEPRFGPAGYASGADRLEDGRAAVAADFDRDGDLDLAIQGFHASLVFLRNQAVEEPRAQRRWLELELTGTRSNRDAVGARVEIEAGGRRQVREVATTSGYLAGQTPILHFGLGAATLAERVSVRWPSGALQRLERVQACQRLRLVEPRGGGGGELTAKGHKAGEGEI